MHNYMHVDLNMIVVGLKFVLFDRLVSIDKLSIFKINFFEE